jgi:hypothetical protein
MLHRALDPAELHGVKAARSQNKIQNKKEKNLAGTSMTIIDVAAKIFKNY